MSKQILVTRTNGDTQYQLYRTKILYPASYNDYKGTIVEQDVLIDVYGIVTIQFINWEVVHYDSGPLSAHSNQVSYLLGYLIRKGINNLEEIREAVWREYETWCYNAENNPFSKIANQILRRKLKKLLH